MARSDPTPKWHRIPPDDRYSGMTTLTIGNRVFKCAGIGEDVDCKLLAKAKETA